jgi:hypothetical protein
MADVDSGNEDGIPHPLDVTADPLNPVPAPIPRNHAPRNPNISIPSVNNPVRFTNANNGDSDSEDEDKKPSHQGHGLLEIAMMKLQKVKALEHNDADPRAWRQAVVYQLIPYALEWLLDSEIPRPEKSHPSYERWKYWSRLIASWMYGQIDAVLQSKVRNLLKTPKYADKMYDELMTMTQGSDMLQTAFLEMRKFDKMKRSDYSSASEYLEEYQKQYHVLARFKAAPSPCSRSVPSSRQPRIGSQESALHHRGSWQG